MISIVFSQNACLQEKFPSLPQDNEYLLFLRKLVSTTVFTRFQKTCFMKQKNKETLFFYNMQTSKTRS